MSTTKQQGGDNLRHALALTTLDTDRPTVPDERDTTITSLRDSLVAANAHAAKLEREAHKDRASIVAFLTAEAKRLDEAAELYEGGSTSHLEIIAKLGREGRERCRVKAGHTRALAAQIARGDDRLGGVK